MVGVSTARFNLSSSLVRCTIWMSERESQGFTVKTLIQKPVRSEQSPWVPLVGWGFLLYSLLHRSVNSSRFLICVALVCFRSQEHPGGTLPECPARPDFSGGTSLGLLVLRCLPSFGSKTPAWPGDMPSSPAGLEVPDEVWARGAEQRALLVQQTCQSRTKNQPSRQTLRPFRGTNAFQPKVRSKV